MNDPPSHQEVFLQIMSDLHLETPRFLPMYSTFHVEPCAKHLALLGDIGNVLDPRLFTFLEEVITQFELVFYILGNHEPYAGNEAFETEPSPMTMDRACERLLDFERNIDHRRRQHEKLENGRFVFMNRRRFDVTNKVAILGCTLFSNIQPEQESTAAPFVSDFSNIHGWTTQLHNAAHARDLTWLNGQINHISATEPDRQIIVLTHHSPTTQREANNPGHLEDPKGIQSAFVTDLSREPCSTSPNVKVWAFGHTHWNCDFVDERLGKRVVANQRGYGREEIFNFDSQKVILLG